MNAKPSLSPEDIGWIRQTGRDPGLAATQLSILSGPTPYTRLVRAAVVGDGIRTLDGDHAELEARHAAAARSGRVSSFVPASGAASRLCKALLQARAALIDDPTTSLTGVAEAVVDGADQLAIWPQLTVRGARTGDPRSILDALFGPKGLGVDSLPKGLIAFHHANDGARTAFEEHMVEAAALTGEASGRVSAHFTVSAHHRDRFDAAVVAARARFEPRLRARFEIAFSVQDPTTDTIAMSPGGAPFRTADGNPLFRPGGHGALIHNLAACGGDIVLVKNIDNVVPDRIRSENLAWRARLCGMLVQLQDEAWSLVRSLRNRERLEEARTFVAEVLGASAPADAEALIARLHRPWRVAGMVVNTGQPGGGPFWVEGPDGPTLQIVEGVQIDRSDAGQEAMLQASTHFNPVDIVAGLRDADGRAFDLTAFIDPGATIVTDKSIGGRPLRALEHPGLWNGSMAGWNTIFVEIPGHTFQPVKTFADLLKPGHSAT